MPLHLKPVKTLFSFALSATSQLVLSTCKNIEDLYPCWLNLHYEFDGCKATVQKVQDFLRENIPASIWEDLFHEVLEERNEMSDERILYGMFIYENVNLKKLAITPYPDEERFDDLKAGSEASFNNGICRLQRDSSIRFWLQQIPSLSKLVKVELNSFDTDDIILALCRCCPELQIMRAWGSNPETYKSVFETCHKLRELCGCRYSVPEALAYHLDTNQILQLRTLDLKYDVSPQMLQLIIEHCPHLQDLECTIPRMGEQDYFRILSASPVRLSRLTLVCDQYHNKRWLINYLACKGSYIKDLSIDVPKSSPVEILQAISETCTNLTRLEFIFDWQLSEQVGNQMPTNRISFPNLEKLEFRTSASRVVDMARLCLADAAQLTKLCLSGFKESEEDLPGSAEAALVELFIHHSHLMKQLRHLHLEFPNAHFSTGFVRQIYESCSNLTYLEIEGLSQGAKLYCQVLKADIKTQNLDMMLMC